MLNRLVADLMTTAVVRVRRETGFKDIALQLAEHDITAVPVVDDQDRPVGVISEADLLRRQARRPGADGRPPAADLPPGESDGPRASTAEGMMTSPAVTARPQWSAVEAARAMARHRVKRLPVVDDAGRLVGIVSRGDLLRIFLRRDRTIREEINTEILTRTLGLAPGAVTAEVTDGRVTLTGTVGSRSTIPVAVRLCESVDGVVDVEARLGYLVDDVSGTPAARPR
jgi:CBS domain-containing protein